jgi:hypothetical protein
MRKLRTPMDVMEELEILFTAVRSTATQGTFFDQADILDSADGELTIVTKDGQAFKIRCVETQL